MGHDRQDGTLRLGAAADYIEATMEVPTLEDAEAIAARFPKAARVRATRLSTYDGTPGQADYAPYHSALVVFRANLRPNGSTGAVNETSIRRYRSFRKAADALAIPVVWVNRYPNSITESDLEQTLADQTGATR